MKMIIAILLLALTSFAQNNIKKCTSKITRGYSHTYKFNGKQVTDWATPDTQITCNDYYDNGQLHCRVIKYNYMKSQGYSGLFGGYNHHIRNKSVDTTCFYEGGGKAITINSTTHEAFGTNGRTIWTIQDDGLCNQDNYIGIPNDTYCVNPLTNWTKWHGNLTGQFCVQSLNSDGTKADSCEALLNLKDGELSGTQLILNGDEVHTSEYYSNIYISDSTSSYVRWYDRQTNQCKASVSGGRTKPYNVGLGGCPSYPNFLLNVSQYQLVHLSNVPFSWLISFWR